MPDRVIETGVLVIGGGGGGFRAAIGAREHGAPTILLSKGPLARCGATPLAGSDLTADGSGLRRLGFRGEPRDSQEKFFNDIIHQGFFLNNQKLVQRYVETATDRLGELIDWGIKVTFSEERALFTSGLEIIDALLRRARQSGVQLIGDMMALDLLTADGAVCGAVALDVYSGELVTFKAKAVVLATGGWHKAYWPNTGSKELTGEGPAMAYRAGAELANMEFITFAANTLLWPPRWAGSIFTYVMHLMVGGALVNSEGRSILEGVDAVVAKYGSGMEWNKCVLSLLTELEVQAGRGSPHGGIFYRVDDRPWPVFKAQVEAAYPAWSYKHGDFRDMERMFREGEGVEVGPAVEYFEGGIAVDEDYQTTLPGLFAAGECALSLFGANRVAAATTEMLVTGCIAGRAAALYAAGRPPAVIDAAQERRIKDTARRPLTGGGAARPIELRRALQPQAHARLGPVRDSQGLGQFIDTLAGLARNELPRLGLGLATPRYNREWLEALELRNLALLLDLAARSAYARTESRGVHYRADYPHTDNDHWLRESRIKDAGGEPRLTSAPAVITSLQPPAGVTPYLDMVKLHMLAHSEVGGHH